MLKDGKLINSEVRIETTNLCNLRCTICPRELLTRRQTIMSFGEFCSLVDQARDLGADTVSLFGFGEPLMDSGLPEKIEYCSGLGLNTYITTNGYLLDYDTRINLMYAGIKHIRFSFHGTSPLNYERVHRRSDWLTAWAHFYEFIELNEAHGKPCKVHLSVIPRHMETVDEIRETWERYPDYLEIWRPHNWGGSRMFRLLNRSKKTCGRPFNGPVQIQADGTVIPCCFLTNSEIVCGDTTKETLKKVLEGEEYQRLREAHRTGEYGSYACRHCDQLNEEAESPLLYSNRDPDMKIGVTSTTKTDVKGEK